MKEPQTPVSVPPEAALTPIGAAKIRETKIRASAKTRKAKAKLPDLAEVAEIFRRFAAADPHPEGELYSVNDFTFLIAVVLSAQATDAGVNKATKALFAIADSPEKMLALGEDKLRDMIKTIGLYQAKAKNIMALCANLIENYGGQVPHDREALQSLAGVGRKTANVVLNIAFGEPTIAVDTHIFRVSNRIPLAIGKTPLAVEQGLEKIVPPEYKLHAHVWLILHGRHVCKARRPECERCIISDLCHSPEKRV
ncbi:endonuclease III [Beijerinckia indica]|uniref:Endonuclease III n=1 Tax=Beijerinckia indica subsp. indica (strain ATCC 9039 / DSM 1715 / NCIMB 8712) TaxID=395963 RepID=B2IC70_BEII9|nr:endonuclease III [Beijerinckia indica]ACB96667.1 endonuclease III [Beijerinckia indica subsp. indica ATCC 9039]